MSSARLLRTIRFDATDEFVFEQAAGSDEWAISGAFAFAHLSDDDIKGKHLTQRERYYAEPLRQKPSFAQFWNYFMFCAASYSGPSHEYRKFVDFINLQDDFK